MLITVMSERELHVPRLGRVVAEPGLPAVAAMNPFDAIGTARISSAVYDRVCRLSVDYQSAGDEEDDRRQARRAADAGSRAGWPRSSRSSGCTAHHPDVRIGSSVRGAIDTAAVAASLAPLRRLVGDRRSTSASTPRSSPLSGRLRLREGCRANAEDDRHRAVGRGVRPSDERGRPREKRQPRTGRTAPEPAEPEEGAAGRRRRSPSRAEAHDVAPRARPQPALRADLARGRRARRGRGRGGAARRPRRDACAARRPRPAPPIRGCASSPAAWPAGCSSTRRRGPADAPGRRQDRRAALPTRRRRPRHRRQLRRDRRGRGRRRRDRRRAAAGPGVEHTRTPRCAWSSTAAARWAASRWRPRRSPRRRRVAQPGDYSVLAFGKDVVVVKARTPTSRRASGQRRAVAARASAPPTSPARCGPRPAARPQQRRAQDRRPAERLPGDGRRRRRSPRPRRCRSWSIVAPEQDSDEAVRLRERVGARIATVAGPSRVVEALAPVLER